MKKSAIVTMFFDLTKLKDANPETRPMSFYLEKGVGTLKLKYPMIIFCDSITKPLIKKMRDEFVDSNIAPTIYVEKNISEYEFYYLNWDIIRHNRTGIATYQKPDQRNTPSYCLTTMFKFIAMQIASLRNDFNATHYAWIDFGCSHVIERFKPENILIGEDMANSCLKMLENPKDKISMLYIHYRSSEELRNMKQFINNGPCSVAATVFTLQKEYITKFYNLGLSIFNEMLLNGCCHSEEGVMAYCYDRHPELFNIYYGDYYSVTKNYHNVTQDYECIKHYFINNCIQKNRLDLAKKAATEVINSIQNKYIALDQKELEYLLNIKDS